MNRKFQLLYRKTYQPNYEILQCWIQLLLVLGAQASSCIFCTSCPKFLISYSQETILQGKVTNLAFPYQLSGPFFPFQLLITKRKEFKLLLSNPVQKGRHIILSKRLKCPTVQPLVNNLWQKTPKPARNRILRYVNLFFLIEVKKMKWT